MFLLHHQNKMKQLEQEAHRAAGQKFLVTSNTQLRTVGCDWPCYWCVFEHSFPSHVITLFGGLKFENDFPSRRVCSCEYHCLLKCIVRYALRKFPSERGLFTLCMCNVLQVLFDKLGLHEQCDNRKLPKTLNKQQQSTSEAAVWFFQTHRGVSLDPLSFFIVIFFQCVHVQHNTSS